MIWQVLRLIKYQFDILFAPSSQIYLADLLSRAAREPNREETMAGQRVEMHISTIVAADNMYNDSMLEEKRKESNKDNDHLQTLEKVRRGWKNLLRNI